MKYIWVLIVCLFGVLTELSAQHSVARQWNEVLLEAIRNDEARPTVHARNLFHTSIAMYDAWAAYQEVAVPFFLGNDWGTSHCPFSNLPDVSNNRAETEKAISYACYRLIRHRFRMSAGQESTWESCDSLMELLGFDPTISRMDYHSGDGASVGNYIAAALIDFGMNDGSNEVNDYANLFYEPVNTGLNPNLSGTYLSEPDRWQPLSFNNFIGQSGIPSVRPPDFLSPEWGFVTPFALRDDEKTIHTRDGVEYWVYHDPGPPPSFWDGTGRYQWGFSLVSWWGSHLSPADSVMWDISPGSIGNLSWLPPDPEDWPAFYRIEGGDPSEGHDLNPVTGQPYTPNIVPRGDYTRVLAEFWADGPDSETPPGHWFTILNYVSDHPDLEKRFSGTGATLDPLEWDVKAYFTMGGAMHDAAISAWSIKGYYDYVRPISAIRHMAMLGQSSIPGISSTHPRGFVLEPGLSEVIQRWDPLEAYPDQLEDQIKLYTWRGPRQIADPETDEAGVGWIIGSNWWPYQRPSFVTPPFAGYISGHSTFSRAAAEVLTSLTGDPFFPGGIGEFTAHKNEFLVFEEGPSVDVTLQWATYRDAADQTSLSRIWGGIHPPADDIPGRLIGEQIGLSAFDKAIRYFSGEATKENSPVSSLFPNPVRSGHLAMIKVERLREDAKVEIVDLSGRKRGSQTCAPAQEAVFIPIQTQDLESGMYLIVVSDRYSQHTYKLMVH